MSDQTAEHTEHCACAAELERVRANANKLMLLVEMFIYEPHRLFIYEANRLSEGGLVAQIQRFRTDQDVQIAGSGAPDA